MQVLAITDTSDKFDIQIKVKTKKGFKIKTTDLTEAINEAMNIIYLYLEDKQKRIINCNNKDDKSDKWNITVK